MFAKGEKQDPKSPTQVMGYFGIRRLTELSPKLWWQLLRIIRNGLLEINIKSLRTLGYRRGIVEIEQCLSFLTNEASVFSDVIKARSITTLVRNGRCIIRSNNVIQIPGVVFLRKLVPLIQS